MQSIVNCFKGVHVCLWCWLLYIPFNSLQPLVQGGKASQKEYYLVPETRDVMEFCLRYNAK